MVTVFVQLALFLSLTSGSLFLTRRTILTDSSSSSSSKSSGRGGSTGSKFFCATVSWTDKTAYQAGGIWVSRFCFWLSYHEGLTIKVLFVPWDVVMSANVAALFPQHSLVHFAAPLPPTNQWGQTKSKHLTSYQIADFKISFIILSNKTLHYSLLQHFESEDWKNIINLYSYIHYGSNILWDKHLMHNK